MSNSLQPHRLLPARLLCPWDSLGQNTRVGCHFLLQGIFLTQGLNLGLLNCRKILYRLSNQGSPFKPYWNRIFKKSIDTYIYICTAESPCWTQYCKSTIPQFKERNEAAKVFISAGWSLPLCLSARLPKTKLPPTNRGEAASELVAFTWQHLFKGYLLSAYYWVK